MLDRKIIERTAGALLTDESLVEKDWHVVRALGVLSALDSSDATPVSSGGTLTRDGENDNPTISFERDEKSQARK